MSKSTTLVRGGWVVGFDGQNHRLIKDGVVVFSDNEITHVGQNYDGLTEKTIDAAGKIIMPGFVSTHAHICSHAGDRITLDAGRRDLFNCGFLNYLPHKSKGGPTFFEYEDPIPGIKHALAELIRHGVTTVVELGGEVGGHTADMVELAGEFGIRLYVSPGFEAGSYYYDDGGSLKIEWNEKKGFEGLEKAIDFIKKYDGTYNNRIKGILVPVETILSTAELLRQTKKAAQDLKVPITIHTAETIFEFQEIVKNRRHTPVGWLHEIGFLGPEVILGHVVFIGGHRHTAYPFEGDLEAIAASGASISHNPYVFSRRGEITETLQRYLDIGINMSLGTDSFPQDPINEMRWAAILCKVAQGCYEPCKAQDVFTMANLGGAKALGREDLGKLEPGAKADIVILDIDRLRIGPYFDPIKALVYCGHGEMVDTVIIDGKVLLRAGQFVNVNEQQILVDVREATKKVWDHFHEYHLDGLSLEEFASPSFKSWEEK